MTTKITAQLAKILALADPSRGATQAEVEAAMAKAVALATKHNIDLSSVTPSGDVKVEPIKVEQAKVGITTKYEAQYHMPILRALKACLGIDWVMYSHWTPNCMRVVDQIIFIGERTDVAIATTCWSWLEKQFPAAWKQYRKETGTPNSWTPARSFYTGMSHGIIEANRKQREALPEDTRNRFALVLVNKEEAIKAEMVLAFPNTRALKTHQRNPHDFDAYHGGKAKGNTIKLKGQLGADLL